MKFELTKKYLALIISLLDEQANTSLQQELTKLHAADVAEIIEELSFGQASYLYE